MGQSLVLVKTFDPILGGIKAFTEMETKSQHLKNAELPMSVTNLESSIETNPLFEKAPAPILFTDMGRFMLFKLLHAPKVLFSILVIPSGITIVVKLRQLPKASSPILVTDSGMIMLVKLLHPEKARLPIITTDSGMLIEGKPLQPENVPSSIL